MKNKRILILILMILMIISSTLIACDNEDTGNLENNISQKQGHGDNDSSSHTSNENESLNSQSDSEDDSSIDPVEESEEGLYKRSEVPDYYKWDLSKIYDSNEDFMMDLSKGESLIAELERQESSFTNSSDTFIDTLEIYEKASRLVNKVYVFATLQAHTDTTNSEYAELEDLAGELSSQLSETAAFIMPSIVSLDQTIIDVYLNNPKIQPYENYI